VTIWVLVAALCFVVVILPVLVDVTIEKLIRRKQAPRGFEVKLNTGRRPVPLKEKENDHG
jgi:hypothetical protein